MPQIKNDSTFIQNGSQFKALKSNAMLTLTKINTKHDSTHRFARIFQSTLASTHSRLKKKGLFKVRHGSECKGMVI
ncbi:hypothetical protein H5410_051041 [Solanum commersonii]|uniref:Uncharacterized protein n=1 Tax=Solanum commersonii TaxID=4109 RepID=A0A9J5WZJ7_SOLCO|nr:hypothetical protein H5410_051041 [Solanum commersonii]